MDLVRAVAALAPACVLAWGAAKYLSYALEPAWLVEPSSNADAPATLPHSRVLSPVGGLRHTARLDVPSTCPEGPTEYAAWVSLSEYAVYADVLLVVGCLVIASVKFTVPLLNRRSWVSLLQLVASAGVALSAVTKYRSLSAFDHMLKACSGTEPGGSMYDLGFRHGGMYYWRAAEVVASVIGALAIVRVGSQAWAEARTALTVVAVPVVLLLLGLASNDAGYWASRETATPSSVKGFDYISMFGVYQDGMPLSTVLDSDNFECALSSFFVKCALSVFLAPLAMIAFSGFATTHAHTKGVFVLLFAFLVAGAAVFCSADGVLRTAFANDNRDTTGDLEVASLSLYDRGWLKATANDAAFEGWLAAGVAMGGLALWTSVWNDAADAN